MDRKRRGLSPVGTVGPSFRERDSERVAINRQTELRHVYAIEVRVRDVSTRGFMAECQDPVAIGSAVSLDVPGIGAVHAQVRWQIGTRMGGLFLDPISLEQCEWTAIRAAPAALASC